MTIKTLYSLDLNVGKCKVYEFCLFVFKYSSLSKITSRCVCKTSPHFKAVTAEICSDSICACFFHSLGILLTTSSTAYYKLYDIFHFPSSKSSSQ